MAWSGVGKALVAGSMARGSALPAAVDPMPTRNQVVAQKTKQTILWCAMCLLLRKTSQATCRVEKEADLTLLQITRTALAIQPWEAASSAVARAMSLFRCALLLTSLTTAKLLQAFKAVGA